MPFPALMALMGGMGGGGGAAGGAGGMMGGAMDPQKTMGMIKDVASTGLGNILEGATKLARPNRAPLAFSGQPGVQNAAPVQAQQMPAAPGQQQPQTAGAPQTPVAQGEPLDDYAKMELEKRQRMNSIA